MDLQKEQEQEKEKEQEATECFICYDSFTEKIPKATPNPCKCKGSIAIHLSCLKTLMNYQNKCKSCNIIYNKTLYVNIYELIEIEFSRNNFYYLAKIEQTQEICEYAFNYNNKCIKAIYDRFKTQSMCCTALLADENNIRYIPKYIQTYDMIAPILTKSIKHIPYIKKEFIEPSLISYYISKKEKSILKYFPKEFQTPDTCKAIIAYDGSQIEYICDDFKSKELELLSLNTFIPNTTDINKYSRDIQEKIVKRHWHMIEYMENPSNALCVHIIKKHPKAIKLLKNPSDEIIILAIRLDWNLVFHFPINYYYYKKAIKYGGDKAINIIVKYNTFTIENMNSLLQKMNIKKECIKIDNEIKILSI